MVSTNPQSTESVAPSRPAFRPAFLRDDAGLPLLVFRGEHGETNSFIHTRLPSISFGSVAAANSYALDPNDPRDVPRAPRVIPAYLRMNRPIINNTDDPFVDLSVMVANLGADKAQKIARKLASSIQCTGHWIEELSREFESVQELLDNAPERIDELYVDAYRVFDDHEIVGWCRDAGFDGAIHIGNGETCDELEYKVFDVGQVMPAIEMRASLGKYMERIVDVSLLVDDPVEDDAEAEECSPGQ